jgi:hypothetical protein
MVNTVTGLRRNRIVIYVATFLFEILIATLYSNIWDIIIINTDNCRAQKIVPEMNLHNVSNKKYTGN